MLLDTDRYRCERGHHGDASMIFALTSSNTQYYCLKCAVDNPSLDAVTGAVWLTPETCVKVCVDA